MLLRTVLCLLFALAVMRPLHAADMPVTQSVALERHAAGTFYVNGQVQGADEMQLLVDTGSSFLVLGEDVLQSLEQQGLATLHHKVRGRMADESVRIVSVYNVAALRLGQSCWLRDVQAAAFPAGSRPILGMRALERLAPFTISMSPAASLNLNQCELQLAEQQGPFPSGDVTELAQPANHTPTTP